MKDGAEIYGVVYRITCLVNGKLYHGQTVNPKTRWTNHFRKDSHCHALRNAIEKYGRENFTFGVVAQATSKEELDVLEIEFVATSLSPKGYNLQEGGANGRPSKETREKLSAASKKAQSRPEVRAKISAGIKAAMARPEVKKRCREALKEVLSRPGERERRSTRMKEVHARPGEKEKRSKALKAYWNNLTEEERVWRLQRQMTGYTDEVRARIGSTTKTRMANLETKEKHQKAIRASMTPERRKAMSRRSKEAWTKPGARERRGAAISKAHNTPEGKRKLAMRRRCRESEEDWKIRVQAMLEEGA